MAHWISKASTDGKVKTVALVTGDTYGKRIELTMWEAINRYGADKVRAMRCSFLTVVSLEQSRALFTVGG
jgi:hypothetical protein